MHEPIKIGSTSLKVHYTHKTKQKKNWVWKNNLPVDCFEPYKVVNVLFGDVLLEKAKNRIFFPPFIPRFFLVCCCSFFNDVLNFVTISLSLYRSCFLTVPPGKEKKKT